MSHSAADCWVEILAWVPVVSGHQSIELISPDSLQGFRLTKALGSQGCNASCLKMGVSAQENVRVSCSPEPLQTRVTARGGRLYILGTPMAPPQDPRYSLISISAVTGADEEPRSEAEWDHGMGCCSLRVMGFV